MSAVRPCKVVKLFPLGQFLIQIHIALVTQQLIKLFLIRAVGSLDLAVELGRSRFDISMSDTQVFDMPMELRLELVAAIGSDLLDAKWKFGDDVINKVDSVLLRMTLVDL